jgi:hypothetical protein
MSLPFLDYLTPPFELHVRAEAKARSTIRIYVAAVRQRLVRQRIRVAPRRQEAEMVLRIVPAPCLGTAARG